MKEMIMDLYNISEEEYNKLVKKYSEKKIFEARWEFMIGKNTRPVTSWVMCYYIETHGNFIERGKRLHHHIARAIYNSMNAKDKVEMHNEIEMQANEYGEAK